MTAETRKYVDSADKEAFDLISGIPFRSEEALMHVKDGIAERLRAARADGYNEGVLSKIGSTSTSFEEIVERAYQRVLMLPPEGQIRDLVRIVLSEAGVPTLLAKGTELEEALQAFEGRYLAAVNGRKEFRELYRREREHNRLMIIALQAHHDWHIDQTEADDHGVIPAEAYAESELCSRTVEVLSHRHRVEEPASDRDYIAANLAKVNDLLAGLTDEDVMTRASLESWRDELKAALAKKGAE